MDEPPPSAEQIPNSPPSSTDEAYKVEHSRLRPQSPHFVSSNDSDSDSGDLHDDYDDPHYPNRHLQLHSSPNIPILSTSHQPSSSSIPHPAPSTLLTSPPRRSRPSSPPSYPTTPPCTHQPPSPPISPSHQSPATPSSPSAPRRPNPPASFPIIPLLPAHGAPSFVPMAQQIPNSATPGPSDTHSPPPFAESPPQDPLSAEDIRQRIRLIAQDPSLSEEDKNKRRQALLSQPFQQRRKKEARAFVEDMHRQRHVLTYSDVDDPLTGNKMPGCEHYPRNCKIKANCCGIWVVCRLCHDQPSMDHAIQRFDTREIMCMFCLTEQPVSQRCINENCKQEFARYFCAKCKFYDNTPNKNIYHCDKCQICRVGKGIGHDNFHCDRCDACVSLEYSKSHRCLKKSLDVNCPICGHYLYTSTLPVVFMRCGHTMHAHCFDTYTAEHYICPLCHKALTNMRGYYSQIDEAMKQEVMPEKHRNKVSEVLCHDCDQRSETPYHFLYLKCQTPDCGSYNTRLLRTFERETGEGSGSAAAAAPGESDQGPVVEMDVQRDDSNNDNNEVMEEQSSSRSSDGSSSSQGDPMR